MRRIVVVMLLLTIPGTLQAAGASGETPDFRRCMDAVDLGANKTSQWLACYEAELKRQDVSLNDAYSAAQAASTPEAQALLTTGERAWLAYRDAWCRFEESTPTAPDGAENERACRLELTLAQIGRLKTSAAGWSRAK